MTDPVPDRGRRLAQQQRAYELQLIGGLQGMAWWTLYGMVGVGLLHRFNPTFRKQTWAIKAFLVSSASIFGLTIGADDYLLKYESAQRDQENAIRREARNALAAKGIIATETEIRRWRAAQQAERDAIAERAREALDNIEGVENVEAGSVARLARARNFGSPDSGVEGVEGVEGPPVVEGVAVVENLPVSESLPVAESKKED
ncbi:hypothetical protein CcaverHIS002_0202190 [Cutaneotrichosporon cavernicola]|uniref:HIG1 domain-containing protein n=1 Tax=Cutaneotrichosporon cavernicola TaxID=279322 RepID=A0AA48I860_9TREE|nr:uncharacterized protein CcaverHIS019_0202220 [Cutaneotrichosporon cavernicola]BEI81059.1 hypothetical protein CcaverHIS002_0202190 [Cutaneotrichosporon cavernicola]BEI88860.1 hypothetical protein CcaverHIS019_0202220 [Cutaneotrichosporon cavernicola]BEI96636.1 hypothetical protein CcaverHIS631_0202250 [Cutaneotrichosporon cavernicola]BEJ04409.1 hypothetical protein CcaverHIS641_0202260 [Cutaneotrichosporon cavernicola]